MNLVINGRLITRDTEGKGYYEHGAVAYEGSKIVEVGEESALRQKYPDAHCIDAKGGVIMPALINAHTHIYSALGAIHESAAGEKKLVQHCPMRPDLRFMQPLFRTVRRL